MKSEQDMCISMKYYNESDIMSNLKFGQTILSIILLLQKPAVQFNEHSHVFDKERSTGQYWNKIGSSVKSSSPQAVECKV